MAMADRRVKRTQRLLAEALISLTLEQGYDAVSIRDITERADIAYATFFRHYDDKDALLDEVVDVILSDMSQLLQPGPIAAEHQAAVGIQIFEYVQAHSELCHVLLGSRGKDRLIEKLQSAKQDIPLLNTSGHIPPEIANYHFMSAGIELIQWWLDHGMPYPPEQMGRIFATLILLPRQALSAPS
jgi:AcrR family transcriptional regulator